MDFKAIPKLRETMPQRIVSFVSLWNYQSNSLVHSGYTVMCLDKYMVTRTISFSHPLWLFRTENLRCFHRLLCSPTHLLPPIWLGCSLRAATLACRVSLSVRGQHFYFLIREKPPAFCLRVLTLQELLSFSDLLNTYLGTKCSKVTARNFLATRPGLLAVQRWHGDCSAKPCCIDDRMQTLNA